MTFMQWPTQRLLFTAPPGWEVLQLYSMGPKLQAEYSQPSALWLQWTFDFWSAGAYIINRNGMRKVPRLTTIRTGGAHVSDLCMMRMAKDLAQDHIGRQGKAGAVRWPKSMPA